MLYTIEQAQEYFKSTVFDVFNGYHLFVAGGAVRDYMKFGRVSNDIDLYFFCNQQRDKFIKDYRSGSNVTKSSKYGFEFKLNDISYHAITYKTFQSIEECVEDFDFPINRAGISFKSIYMSDKYLDSLENMIIDDVNDQKLDSDLALYRLIKMVKKGFTPTDEVVNAIKNIIRGEDVTREDGKLVIKIGEQTDSYPN